MTCPTNSEINALLLASVKPQIDDVPTNIDDPSTNAAKKTPIGDVPDSTFTLEDPPRNIPSIEEEVEIMFEDDSTSVAATPL